MTNCSHQTKAGTEAPKKRLSAYNPHHKLHDEAVLDHARMLNNYLDCDRNPKRLEESIGGLPNWHRKEKAVFAVEVVKQNDRGKQQTRHFLLTSHAVYNFLPEESAYYDEPQRMIVLEKLRKVTTSRVTQEVVLVISGENDYHLIFARAVVRDAFLHHLKAAVQRCTQKELEEEELVR